MKTSIRRGSMLLLGLAIVFVLSAIGRLDMLVWLIGVLALLANSAFVRRDMAAGEIKRGSFYAVFGTAGLLALFFNVSLWMLGSKPIIPEHLQAMLPDIKYILISTLAFAVAGFIFMVALRRYRKPR